MKSQEQRLVEELVDTILNNEGSEKWGCLSKSDVETYLEDDDRCPEPRTSEFRSLVNRVYEGLGGE